MKAVSETLQTSSPRMGVVVAEAVQDDEPSVKVSMPQAYIHMSVLRKGARRDFGQVSIVQRRLEFFCGVWA